MKAHYCLSRVTIPEKCGPSHNQLSNNPFFHLLKILRIGGKMVVIGCEDNR